ncbi:MAG: hypothetical protein WBX25_37320, partial [Rhodomicrobium sp.]
SDTKLHDLLLHYILRDKNRIRETLEKLNRSLEILGVKARKPIIDAILRTLEKSRWLQTSGSVEELRSPLMAFVMAYGPLNTPNNYAKFALRFISVLRMMFPDRGYRLKLDPAKDPINRISPIFAPDLNIFLRYNRWGKLSVPINHVLWAQIWDHLADEHHKPSTQQPSTHDLDCSIARLYQIELSLRPDIFWPRSLNEKIRSILAQSDEEVAKQFAGMMARHRALLQAIRNIAAFRKFKAQGSIGELAPFDARLHTSSSTGLNKAELVKILESPIVRELPNGSSEILIQGEVEKND